MNILAIETSTKSLSLAVARDEKILRVKNKKLLRPLSSSIMPSIKEILGKAGCSLKQLDGFAVGLGPGSFTSLRVGLSTVKGLAFATGKPVVGISSLDVLAMNVKEDHVRICTLCDAKRNLVYACLYEKKDSMLKKKSKYFLSGVDEVLIQIKKDVVFIGDGVHLYRHRIKKAKGITPTFVDGNHVHPQAKWLAHLASKRFRDGKVDNIDQLVPLYLYPKHCQVQNNTVRAKR